MSTMKGTPTSWATVRDRLDVSRCFPAWVGDGLAVERDSLVVGERAPGPGPRGSATKRASTRASQRTLQQGDAAAVQEEATTLLPATARARIDRAVADWPRIRGAADAALEGRDSAVTPSVVGLVG